MVKLFHCKWLMNMGKAKIEGSRRKREIIIGITGGLVAIVLYSLINAGITGNIVKDEELVLYFPSVNDFSNTAEGTGAFTFNFPDSGFMVGNKTADKRIKGGSPMLVSNEVEINDGKSHTILYTFSKSLGKQAIILDGQLMVEGDFVYGENALTGMVTYTEGRWIESDFEIVARFD